MYLTRFSVIRHVSCQDVSLNSALGNTYWGRRDNGNNLNLPMRFGWYHYSLHMSWMSILYISILICKITMLIPTSLSFCRIRLHGKRAPILSALGVHGLPPFGFPLLIVLRFEKLSLKCLSMYMDSTGCLRHSLKYISKQVA